MRWNCPHCGVALAVGDEKLGAGWTFSRCYKCSGFALLRRPETSLIKVDKAPTDGNFLLPISNDGPMLSQPATERLNELVASVQKKSAPALPAALPPLPMHMPESLPEVKKHSLGLRMLPIAIGFTMAMTAGSGAYLFMQGQAVWQKAREIHEMGSASVGVSSNEEQTITAAAAPMKDFVPEPAPPKALSSTAMNNAVTSLLVEIKAPIAKLRSGPGLRFPIQGTVHENLRLSVSGFSDRWFQVIVPTDLLASSEEPAAKEVKQQQQAKLEKHVITPGKPQLMWIRNDLVRLVQPDETND